MTSLLDQYKAANAAGDLNLAYELQQKINIERAAELNAQAAEESERKRMGRATGKRAIAQGFSQLVGR